eukprot:TRINITY_DN19628_c0_g1_i2.p2 TRINITY_DN19628_c0_g1~~TRINITY_DN19628_c0_g1_i2.p2  ORF type:complete len:251 (+),score=97.37 TRINITY_DN19628_c0_g1_i2:83-835(+)
MIRRPPRSTLSSSSAASDVYKRQYQRRVRGRTRESMPTPTNKATPTFKVLPPPVLDLSEDGPSSKRKRDSSFVSSPHLRPTSPKMIDTVDGKSMMELLGQGEGYTYNDIIVLPGHINFGVDEVNLGTFVTKNIQLNLPFVSSPMDTVTEADMAIAMALCGGIGIIHYNNTIDEQQAMVRKVKRFENGFIVDPMCMAPEQTLGELRLMAEQRGFSSFPVTAVSYTHLRAHETPEHLVCRLLLEKKKKKKTK